MEVPCFKCSVPPNERVKEVDGEWHNCHSDCKKYIEYDAWRQVERVAARTSDERNELIDRKRYAMAAMRKRKGAKKRI